MHWTVRTGMKMWKMRMQDFRRWITRRRPEEMVENPAKNSESFSYSGSYAEEEELQAIFGTYFADR